MFNKLLYIKIIKGTKIPLKKIHNLGIKTKKEVDEKFTYLYFENKKAFDTAMKIINDFLI